MERALVLQSLGIPFVVEPYGAGCHLVVPAERAATALAELTKYETENVDWPPRYDAPPLLSKGKLGAGLYAALIVLMYPVGRQGFLGYNFWEAGMMKARAVFDGEWWRAITALTLHGGLSHLIGNAVFGMGFALLAAHSLGGGLTWLGFVLAGSLGNLLNAWLQGPDHNSIGASTGVFGVLALLAAYEWSRRHTLRYPPMRRFAPLIGGIALFGFLGVGGADSNTDVIAHVTGLVCGGALGALAAWSDAPSRLGAQGQRLAAALGAAILAGAWILALGRPV